MKIHFADLNPAVVLALFAAFHDVEGIDASQRSILDLEGDAIVSPANSFGWMDGGIDLAYRNRFGMQIEQALQQRINEFYGEGGLPVGQALAVPTSNFSIPLMISAPTMHSPGMDVSGTENAYLAMRAALTVAVHANVKTLLCPGLCTATGRMSPACAATQMRRAFDEVIACPF